LRWRQPADGRARGQDGVARGRSLRGPGLRLMSFSLRCCSRSWCRCSTNRPSCLRPLPKNVRAISINQSINQSINRINQSNQSINQSIKSINQFIKSTSVTHAREIERTVRALAELYNACNGDEWVRHEGWLDGDPCATPIPWFGVSCSNISNVPHVTAMYADLSSRHCIGAGTSLTLLACAECCRTTGSSGRCSHRSAT